MAFNKDQREGVAKVLDNLATACMVALVVSGTVDHKISLETGVALFAMFVVLAFMAITLRKGDAA